MTHTPQSNNSTPAIALLGVGYWGKNLARNFNQLGALKLICDKNETLLAHFRNLYPGIETCIALNDVLLNDDIDGVVIATPAETHYTLAREVLLAGKHVYVEKPLVLHEEEALELIGLARKRNLKLMVGHLLQYHPVFTKLKELAQEGALGRINYIYSHRLNLGKIRREENALWSFAPHDISMILALAGEEPESILTTGGNYLHKRIADVTTTHLEFPSGIRAHIFVSWLHPFKDQKLVVVGDKQMAVFDDTAPWPDKLLLYPHEIKWQNNVPVPAKAEARRCDVAEAEPLKLECEHFLSCVINNHVPLTDGREGLSVLRILNASQRSLDSEGNKIVLNNHVQNQESVQLFSHIHPDSIRTFSGSHGITTAFENVSIHETAVVDADVQLGKDTRIWHFSHILGGTKIGEACNIGQNVVVGPDVIIGNNCKIQNNVSVYKGVTLEDGVFCGPSMVFTNVYNPRAEIRKMEEARPTLVKKGATIGANATIVCGTVLGRYCFIGAGAVVIDDVPDHALMVGNPAEQKGWVCQCGEKLNGDFICPKCNKEYKQLGVD